MATTGLFGGGGTSPQEVLQLMNRENEARVQQAGVGARQGGFQAQMMAQASERGRQALGNLFGNGMQAAGMDMPQDPRMAKAAKREKDRTEIIAILKGYADPASPGGVNITEAEMKEGYAQLTARGYPDEASRFLKDAKIISDMAFTKRRSAGGTTDTKLGKTKLIQDKNGNKYFTRMQSIDGVNKTIYSALNSDAPKKPVGAGNEIQIIDDNVGQTGDVKLQRALDKAGFKSGLNKEEAKLKQKLAVEEALLKKKNETQFETRNRYVSAGVKARRGRENVSTALELSRRVKSGGLASNLNDIKGFFGVEPADVGDFNARTGNLVLSVLKDLLGARPTDTDLNFLVDKMAGMVKSKKVNVRLLETALDKIDNTTAIGDWWSDSKNAKKNLSDFSLSLKEEGVGEPNTATTPLTVKPGQDFDTFYENLPSGSYYVNPNGKPSRKK